MIWISVKDRLPDIVDSHSWPVLWSDGVNRWRMFVSTIDSAGNIYSEEGFEMHPTHWMPLPEVPESAVGKMD